MGDAQRNVYGLPVPRLVVVASIDSLRYDCINAQPHKPFLRSLGNATSFDTPTTDSLVAESVYFRKAIAHAGYTPLSHATLFTGTYSHKHGVVDFATTCRREPIRTLTDLLAERGYRTIVTGKAARIFVEDNRSLAHVEHVFEHETPALDLIRDHPADSFVLVSHFNDVHYPQVLPEFPGDDPAAGFDYDLLLRLLWGGRVARPDQPRDAKQNIHLRTGNTISYMDLVACKPSENADVLARHLWQLVEAYLFGWEKFDRHRWARFVNRLRGDGRWNETCFCTLADHGDQQRPYFPWSIQHGSFCNEQLVRVPLLLRSPRLQPKQVDDLVGLVDVLPTLLELCGIDVEALGLSYQLDGRSLLAEPPGEAERSYYIENYEAHLPAGSTQVPVVANRAIRYGDGRKYLFTGDVIERERLENAPEDDVITYLGQRVMGHTPTPYFREQIRSALKRSPRPQVAEWLVGQVPRFAIYDVDKDPLEKSGTSVHPQHPRWPEYAARLTAMAKLTGQPNPRAYDSRSDEEKVTERLKALGYVD